ncbi:MAG: hypothetical protein ACWGHH_06505 [Sulfurovaceae bacterium]
MRKTNEITLQSIEKTISLRCLTVKEVGNLTTLKDGFFSVIKEVLQKISQLKDADFNRITMQDAVALVVYYRAFFWDNYEVSDDPILYPSDFISTKENIELNKTYRVQELEYRANISLNRAIQAEDFARASGDIKNLRYYLMGAGYIGELKDGVDAILGAYADALMLGELIEYNEAIKSISPITLDLLDSSEKIVLLANGGSSLVALPFRSSRFFSFWV